MDTISTNILVSGKVQGVGFRYATKQKADYLNLKGWVKNLEDGRVEIQADGTNKQVEKLISAINHNLTPISHVSHIEVTEVNSEEVFSDFSII